MRRVVLSLIAGVLLAASSAASVLAAPPARFTITDYFIFPDFDRRLVLFVNLDRETFCTAETIAFEEAFIDWVEGGEVGEPPQPPQGPDGFDPISVQEKETGQGALVLLLKASGLQAEVWEMDADAPGIGACTDTDGANHRIGTGTASIMANDNDVFASGTRANAFGQRGRIDFVDEAGDQRRYTWMFHVSSRCAERDGFLVCDHGRTSLH